MPNARAVSPDILTAALAGLEAQKKTIDEKIHMVQTFLGTVPKRRGRAPKKAPAPAPVAAMPAPKKRPKMSDAARKKIAEATKKRWAAARKAGRTRLG